MPLTPEESQRLQQLEDMKRLAELEQRRAMSHTVSAPAAPKESEEFKQGRQLPEWAQFGLKAADVLTQGYNRQMVSPKTAETFKGAKTEFEERHPILSPFTTLAGSLVGGMGSAPTASVKTGMREIGPIARAGRAALQGATQGAISGATESNAKTSNQYMMDILQGGGFGAMAGAGGSAVGGVLGPVFTNIAERTSGNVALNEAQKRLAKALMRDAPEGVDFATYVRSRMDELGPEARMFDIGENTRKLADILATIPGRGRSELLEIAENRAATRGERLAASAQENFNVGGKRLASTVDDLVRQRQQDAGPLYTQAYSMSVNDPNGTLSALVRRADELGATKVAKDIAENEKITRGLPGWSLTPQNATATGNFVNVQPKFNVSDLGRIKEGLDTLISKQYDAVNGKYTPLGTSLMALRDKLKQETIKLTTDPKTGKSAYRDALEAFSGPSGMMDAANAGKSSLNRNISADALQRDLQNMTESERDAFKVGAFEAIREKVGSSEGGRTEMLNLVRNFVPREKLTVIFGSEEAFNKFYKTASAERVMREAEKMGKGSQSTPRAVEMGELDVSPTLEGLSMAGNVAAGNAPGILSSVAKNWNRIQLPESTRDQLARMLMQRGPQAGDHAFNMMETIRRMNEQRARRAALIGSAGAGATSQE